MKETELFLDLMVQTRRHKMVRNSHPLIGKEVKAQKILIPVDQKIAQIQEAIDCYQGRIDALQAELKIYRDE